ncbi:lysine-sensitive aspartokinase 3 [Rhodohalobacter sulfatireducens]|uniref:Aspartokinase n=1 Tax=Rhodohalobacter sulfatireducens TaxID=2911366 RepID=A0ABS9KDV0_9BACT|nr:lysine-sensitive aspartokinase 3 [Rhodohalobacter sulfatireducens]MCG2589006.1 lysine-sensitive aspartokinase 3 [Rhodohalobacter sulfatireducens]
MPDLIKVAKFGGTSMADLTAMRRCASIVSSDPDKKIIVVSATAGTTNHLTELTVEQSVEERKQIFIAIRKKHLSICKDLGNPALLIDKVENLLDALEAITLRKQIMTPMLRDEILSFGERLSSTIFTEVLKQESGDEVEWLDARRVIKTDDDFGNAEPDIPAISEAASKNLQPLLAQSRIVTQGFIASEPNGHTTTLGRGGSDYSAALFAEAVDADVLEIWTDVTAIYTTDPRIVSDARPITEISFDEAAELSVFGAKVLHPATMVPAIRKNIRVYVGSSIHPEKPGTWIVRDTKDKPILRAISLRRNQTLVKVHSLDMLHRYGFLAKLFQVLAEHKISVDLVTTSEVSVALTLDTDVNKPDNSMLDSEVLKELQKFSEVEIVKNLSLIALVGNNLDATAGLSGPVFGSLQETNIHLICHGASSHNLCFLVAEDEAEDVVRVLHKRFIKS